MVCCFTMKQFCSLLGVSWMLTLTLLRAARPLEASLSVPALIIFGDSTVDVGMNNNLTTVIRSNFPPYGRDFTNGKPTGRFCDGQLPVDYLATNLGLPFPLAYYDPHAEGENLLYGINFASSASGYFDHTAQIYNVVSLTKQLELFQNYKKQLTELVGTARASYIVSEAVYILSTGSNDYVDNYFVNPILMSKMNKDQYRSFLIGLASDFFQKLYNLGARKVGVVSIPPLGCLPSQISLFGKGKRDCVQFQNKVANQFNQNLQDELANLRANFPDYRIVYLDCFSILSDMVEHPSKYGLEDVSSGCCGTGTVEVAVLCNRLTPTCKNASTYLFWDSYHPTQAMYEVIANKFYENASSQLL